MQKFTHATSPVVTLPQQSDEAREGQRGQLRNRRSQARTALLRLACIWARLAGSVQIGGAAGGTIRHHRPDILCEPLGACSFAILSMAPLVLILRSSIIAIQHYVCRNQVQRQFQGYRLGTESRKWLQSLQCAAASAIIKPIIPTTSHPNCHSAPRSAAADGHYCHPRTVIDLTRNLHTI